MEESDKNMSIYGQLRTYAAQHLNSNIIAASRSSGISTALYTPYAALGVGGIEVIIYRGLPFIRSGIVLERQGILCREDTVRTIG